MPLHAIMCRSTSTTLAPIHSDTYISGAYLGFYRNGEVVTVANVREAHVKNFTLHPLNLLGLCPFQLTHAS